MQIQHCWWCGGGGGGACRPNFFPELKNDKILDSLGRGGGGGGGGSLTFFPTFLPQFRRDKIRNSFCRGGGGVDLLLLFNFVPKFKTDQIPRCFMCGGGGGEYTKGKGMPICGDHLEPHLAVAGASLRTVYTQYNFQNKMYVHLCVT